MLGSLAAAEDQQTLMAVASHLPPTVLADVVICNMANLPGICPGNQAVQPGNTASQATAIAQVCVVTLTSYHVSCRFCTKRAKLIWICLGSACLCCSMQDPRLTARQAIAEPVRQPVVQTPDPSRSRPVKGEVNFVKVDCHIHVLGLLVPQVLPLLLNVLLLCCRLCHRSQDSSSWQSLPTPRCLSKLRLPFSLARMSTGSSRLLYSASHQLAGLLSNKSRLLFWHVLRLG